MTRCRKCRKPIKFAKHVSTGKAHPVDEETSHDGDLVLFHEGGALMVRHAKLPADQLRPRHKSHFATCPKAEDFRRR